MNYHMLYVIHRLTNVVYYTKHFFFKSAFGRLILLFMFVTIFNIYFFSQFYWPKFLHGYKILTSTSADTSSESLMKMIFNFYLLFVSFVICQYDHLEMFQINYRQDKVHVNYLE